MDRRLLATSLLLLPSLASAASQCMLQPSELGEGIQSAQQPPSVAQPSRPQPVQATVSSPSMRIVSVVEISRVPALRRIASTGAQLTDLGTEHGLRTVFARNGQSFQVFYLTPDGQGAVGGVMWDAAGRNITRQQVSSIDGHPDRDHRRSPNCAFSDAAVNFHLRPSGSRIHDVWHNRRSFRAAAVGVH